MYRFLFDSFMRFCKQKGTLAGITRTLYSLLRIYFNIEITDSRHFSFFLQENWENIWSIQQKHLPLQRKKPRWRNRLTRWSQTPVGQPIPVRSRVWEQKRRELKNLSAFFVFLRHKGGLYTLGYIGSAELKDKYIKIVWRL